MISSDHPEVHMTPPARPARRDLLWPLLALVAFGGLFQGARPILDPDEGRYTAVSVEMVRTGDWLNPQLNDDQPHWTKPPLTYWLVGSSVLAFGRTPAAARLPNTLALIATILLVAAIGRTLTPSSAWLAAIVYATSLYPFTAANVVTTDTLLTLWETLAVFGFVRYRFSPERPRSALLLMWVGFGLAFLTKGPPGLLPLLAIVVFVTASDGWRALPRLAPPAGLALFALLGLGWFAVVIARQPELLSYFLGNEVAARIFTDDFHRNAGWLGLVRAFGPVIAAGTLPWGALALWRWWRHGRVAGRPAESDLSWSPQTRFLLLWILLPLAVFFLASSRLPLYLLPLSVPVSILLARSLWRNAPEAAQELPLRVSRGALATWVLVLLALRLAAGLAPLRHDIRPLAAAVRSAAAFAPAEVIFVDKRPLYSLTFYLATQVERVNLHPPAAGSPEAGYQSFSEQVEQRVDDVVYLVPESGVAELTRQARALGAEPSRIGELDPYLFFVLNETGASRAARPDTAAR
jgi:4-amino-4-deoxy-L-arabinose transferase